MMMPVSGMGRPWSMSSGILPVGHSARNEAVFASGTGTTMWDLASREQLVELPGFCARLLHKSRNSLLAFGTDEILELSLP